MPDKIEIMSPVGSYESLHAAIQGGANAVYFGVGKLNMRSRSAANFTVGDLPRIVGIASEARCTLCCMLPKRQVSAPSSPPTWPSSPMPTR